MELILLRAAIAPCLVLLVSLSARRLGPRFGGQLLGAPATTGPFLLLLSVSSGTRAAATASRGSVAGQLAVACFCLAYGRLAPALRPAVTLALALPVAAVAGLAGTLLGNVWLTAGTTAVVIVVGLLTWPPSDDEPTPTRRARAWELPARMALSGLTVLAATAVADAVGPFAGGALSSVPVLLAVMAPSMHHRAGGGAAADMMRGALLCVAGTIGFLLVLSFGLAPLGPGPAFPLALTATVLIDCLTEGLLSPREERRASRGR